MLHMSTEPGFAVNAEEIFAGVNSIGLALRDRTGAPFASLMLAGPANQFPLKKLDHYRKLLEEAATGLQAAPVAA